MFDQPTPLRDALREAVEELALEEYKLGTLYDQSHIDDAPYRARIAEARAHVSALLEQIPLVFEAK